MARIRITGWKVGLNTVHAIKEIRAQSGCALGEALATVNNVLNNEEAIVDVPDQEAAIHLVDSLAALGMTAEIRMTMRLVGPHRYTVTVQDGWYVVLDSEGRNNFVTPVTTSCPKLYVFAVGNRPIYIGQTVQGMGARMRLGFSADGSSGYHGYRWRQKLDSAELFVWRLEDVAARDPRRDLECIESEIVFAYRIKYDQWPEHQTEIHFHQSSAEHRSLASQVFGFFPDDALVN